MPHKDPEARRAYRRTYYALHRADYLRRKQAYRKRHPERAKAQDRAGNVARYHRNRAHILEQASLYNKAHRTERQQYQNAYRRQHPELRKRESHAYYLKYQEREREKHRIYRQAHPEQDQAKKRRRRAQKLQALHNDLTHAQWLEIQAAQEHRCYYCGARCKGKLTQDHLTPLSQGGSHTLANVIGACRSCNAKKHTNPPPIPVQPLLLTIAPAKKPRRASRI